MRVLIVSQSLAIAGARSHARLSVARDHPGVNNNLLAPPEFVDAISGNAAVNGIPVEVSPA